METLCGEMNRAISNVDWLRAVLVQVADVAALGARLGRNGVFGFNQVVVSVNVLGDDVPAFEVEDVGHCASSSLVKLARNCFCWLSPKYARPSSLMQTRPNGRRSSTTNTRDGQPFALHRLPIGTTAGLLIAHPSMGSLDDQHVVSIP